MPPMKKVLRASQNSKAPVVDAPLCKFDQSSLTFDPIQGAWTCSQCTNVEFPEADLQEFGGAPIVGEGPLELMVYRGQHDGASERTYVLRSTVSNIVMDMTPYVVSVRKGPGGSQTVTFSVERVVEIDEYKRPR